MGNYQMNETKFHYSVENNNTENFSKLWENYQVSSSVCLSPRRQSTYYVAGHYMAVSKFLTI